MRGKASAGPKRVMPVSARVVWNLLASAEGPWLEHDRFLYWRSFFFSQKSSVNFLGWRSSLFIQAIVALNTRVTLASFLQCQKKC